MPWKSRVRHVGSDARVEILVSALVIALLSALGLAAAATPVAAAPRATQTPTASLPSTTDEVLNENALAKAPKPKPVLPVTIAGLDAHDGTIVQDGKKLFLYGSRYGCGFTWQSPSPWCGFGVWRAKKLAGPWTYVRDVFTPTGNSPWSGLGWQQTCGGAGDGCFNPRMIKRNNGTWMFAFNAPSDYVRTGANAYYFMGCNGPAGPCGPQIGAKGWAHKPAMYFCNGNGDFSLFKVRTTAFIACTRTDQTIAIEQLDSKWLNGTHMGAGDIAGARNVESPQVIQYGSKKFVLTYGATNCGYCASGTSWALSKTPVGPFEPIGRVDSARKTTCGGQPRTAFAVDNQYYEWSDVWTPAGAMNQTLAPIILTPLKRVGSQIKIKCPA